MFIFISKYTRLKSGSLILKQLIEFKYRLWLMQLWRRLWEVGADKSHLCQLQLPLHDTLYLLFESNFSQRNAGILLRKFRNTCRPLWDLVKNEYEVIVINQSSYLTSQHVKLTPCNLSRTKCQTRWHVGFYTWSICHTNFTFDSD